MIEAELGLSDGKKFLLPRIVLSLFRFFKIPSAVLYGLVMTSYMLHYVINMNIQ
jgi:hypothetical protein